MKRQSTAHLIDLLFPLALFCAFAATSLLVVVIGADVYRRTTEEMDRNFATRTPLSYLSQALHRGDVSDGISAQQVGDSDALILSETIDGVPYNTYLYCYEGDLRELFARADIGFSPENGQVITGCASIEIDEVEQGLYQIRCTTAMGDQTEILAASRATPTAP